MFDKVLIANRGVIACRIIRTLHAMGVQAVAVYSEADRNARHVDMADEAYLIGEGPAAASYLRTDRILEVAKQSGTKAIHPGYGFLSENADFAQACEEAGIAFIGPTPQQMRVFGPKHSARAIALRENVPLLPGSGLLSDVDEAVSEAARIGYPVMLKSTAGGGGIGMRLVQSEEALREAYKAVGRLAQSNFKDAGLYVERFVTQARHIEVQLFGDGRGNVIALGERDCSVQRRNQKVVEETPAPHLSNEQRVQLHEAALRLGRAVNYRSAGTVEFVLDAERGEFYFLEVNTRLQVEHGVTEQVAGVDLVEWMVRVAADEMPALQAPPLQGASIQVRVYAEDPGKDFRPCAGLLTQADFPSSEEARVETWVDAGTEVPPFYDPMLAKIIVTGETREAAVAALQRALDSTHLAGIETNLAYLRQIARDRVFAEGKQTTAYLSTLPYQARGVDVVEAGIQTMVQDWPGRLGYWNVGVPPSGPMDALALRLGNRLLGNPENAAALECTVVGPTLRFRNATSIVLTGADMGATLDGIAIAPYGIYPIAAGATLKMGAVRGAGVRAYIAITGGFDVPPYLGSRSTFTLGNFGGHAGRTLRVGDVLPVANAPTSNNTPVLVAPDMVPQLVNEWEIGVLYGPHGAPDFFTPEDIENFFAASWEVHYNSSRTGVRLLGPKPTWARQDGGEAGLHPSNIHDNAYAVGAIDFTGDTPIILGPDGPSLGGFVCPACVVESELWKVGQLRPGNRIRFVPISFEEARERFEAQNAAVENLELAPLHTQLRPIEPGGAVLYRREAQEDENEEIPSVTYRAAGDAYLLVEYGPLVLDLKLRMRVHQLMLWLEGKQPEGLVDLTPGIRSLQLHFDPRRTSREALLNLLQQAEAELSGQHDVKMPTRIVHMPLSWDDPATQLAIERYMTSVRPDAPWCPSNIEFIRRINGLESIDEVCRIVFEASYLVLGLGDVYLGAPVATPVDPRHRLVTTKYNPARTWTPQNAVGIGGAYMCIYGMEGPGGYQFVGRTLQVWNTYRTTRDFEAGKPWLLRFFDQVRFYPASKEELLEMRADFLAGRFALRIEETHFQLSDYTRFLEEHAASIREFKTQQQRSFEEERERWIASGQADYQSENESNAPPPDELEAPEGALILTAPTSGMVWKVNLEEGAQVSEGDVILVLESMKTEFPLPATSAGQVLRIACTENQQVTAGQPLVVLQPIP
ncbi:acetyl-/propionyl-coenzyme A carboxylase alpha chain [Abditibacteriota bacterium]|nr:acetyl-/propionyl-coenzyme A carboxylase alpha chain [Abditibacteriota bacterium]